MQPSAQTQQNCLHIAIVLRNDEHADTELFDGLAAFRFINKCFAGRGKRRWFATGQLERSTSWFFVLGAGLRAMLLAPWSDLDPWTTVGVEVPTTAAKQFSL